jgi:hypothetical protein
MVIVDVRDIGIRRAGEDAAVAQATTQGTQYLPSYRYLPPGEQWKLFTVVQKDSLYAANGIDGVMFVGATGSGTSETPYSSATAACTYRDAYGNCNRASATATGGTITKPWMSTSVVVLAVPSRVQVWTATANSGGGATVGFARLMESVVSHAVGKLKSDGIAN